MVLLVNVFVTLSFGMIFNKKFNSIACFKQPVIEKLLSIRMAHAFFKVWNPRVFLPHGQWATKSGHVRGLVELTR